MYRSIDGGDNWNLLVPVVVNLLTAIDFPNPQIGYITGSSGTLLKSEDGGATWVSKSGLPADFFSDIAFLNKDSGFVVGNNGLIYRTFDGGDNWTQTNSPVSTWLHSADCPSSTRCYAAGRDGKILLTISNGNTWLQQQPPLNDDLNAIFFLNNNHGFAVGDNGVVLQTCPNASFDAPDLLDLAQTDTVFFTNTSSSATSFTWDFGDGSPISTDENPIHIYSTPDTFTVWLFVENISGCVDSVSMEIEVVAETGVPELANIQGLQLYPNPTNHNATLAIQMVQSQDLTLENIQCTRTTFAQQASFFIPRIE